LAARITNKTTKPFLTIAGALERRQFNPEVKMFSGPEIGMVLIGIIYALFWLMANLPKASKRKRNNKKQRESNE
jgi:hypothetical protein